MGSLQGKRNTVHKVGLVDLQGIKVLTTKILLYTIVNEFTPGKFHKLPKMFCQPKDFMVKHAPGFWLSILTLHVFVTL